MATLDLLLAIANGTVGPRDWDSQAFGDVDEGISGADGNFIARSTSTPGDVDADTSFQLTDVNSDFGNMDTLLFNISYRIDLNSSSDDTVGLEIRIMSGATVLAAADSGGGFQEVLAPARTPTSFTTSGATTFDFVNGTATKAQWDAAEVEIRNQFTQFMSPDTNKPVMNVETFEFTGTYTEDAGSFTPETTDWRFFQDDAQDPTIGNALAAENTKPTLDDARNWTKLRFKMLIEENGGVGDTDGVILLQMTGDGGTTWWDATQASGAIHAYVTDGQGINGNTIATTRLTNANTAGEYREDQVGTQTISANETGLEIDFCFYANVIVPDTDYDFRILWDGTPVPVKSGSAIPQIRGTAAADRSNTIVKLDHVSDSGEPQTLNFGQNTSCDYDGANWWMFYNQPIASQATVMRYKSWGGTGGWSSEDTISFTDIGGTRKHSMKIKEIGGTKYVFLLVASSGTQWYLKRGTISGTTITWDGTERSITIPPSGADSSSAPVLDIDDGDFLWIGGKADGTSSVDLWAAQSVNIGSHATYYTFNAVKTLTDANADGSNDAHRLIGLASGEALLVYHHLGDLDIRACKVTQSGGFGTAVKVSASADAGGPLGSDWGVARGGGDVYMGYNEGTSQAGAWAMQVYSESGDSWAAATDPSVTNDTTSNDGQLVAYGDDGNVYMFSTFVDVEGDDTIVQYKAYTGGTSGTWDGSLTTMVGSGPDHGNMDNILVITDPNGGGKILVFAERGDDPHIGTEWVLEYFVVEATGAGQTIAVGVLVETNALVGAGPEKIASVGVLAETNPLVGAQAIKVAPVGVLANTDALVGVQARKIADVGVLAELDVLVPAVPVKPIIQAVGVLPETETPIAIQARKIAPVGVLAEIDALIPAEADKPIITSVGVLPEIDTFIPAVPVKPIVVAVGTISEANKYRLDLPGTSGHHISTPNHASLAITGHLSGAVYVIADDYTPPADSIFLAKHLASGNQRSWIFDQTLTGGTLRFRWSSDGTLGDTIQKVSSVGHGFIDVQGYWVGWDADLDDGAGDVAIQFFTSTDSPDTPEDQIQWTKLGITITDGSTSSIFVSTAELSTAGNAGDFGPFKGKHFRGILYDGALQVGAVVADFNGNDFNIGDSDTATAVDSTGKTWTIHGASSSIIGGGPQPISARKISTIGVLAEVDALISIAAVKPIITAVGVLPETDSLVAIPVVQGTGQIIAVTVLVEADALVGVAALKVANIGTLLESEALIAAVAVKPILHRVGTLVEGGIGFVSLDGVNDVIQTSDKAALDVTGDIELISLVYIRNLDELNEDAGLWDKFASNAGYRQFVTPAGSIRLDWGDGSGDFFRGSFDGEITAGRWWWIRSTLDADDGASGHRVRHYKSTDPPDTPRASVSWGAAIRDVTTAGVTSIGVNGKDLEFGQRDALRYMDGRVGGGWIFDGIGGTEVANPDFRDDAQGWSSPPGTDDHGNSWAFISDTFWHRDSGPVTIQPKKIATIGTLSETESLIAIQALKLAQIGVLAELDSLIAIQARKIAPVGTLAQIDILIPAQARKIASVGVLAEIESLIAIQARKVAPVGVLAEFDTLIAAAVVQGNEQVIAVNALAEIDTLIPIPAIKVIITSVGVLAETDSLVTITGEKLAPIGTLAETDSLIVVEAVKVIVTSVGVMAEIDSLLVVGAEKIASVGVLAETDSLIAVQARKVALIGTLAEVGTLIPISLVKPIITVVGTLAEIESLVAIAASKVVPIGVLAEIESLIAVEVFQEIINVGTLAEIDSLITVTVDIAGVITGVLNPARTYVVRARAYLSRSRTYK